MTTEVLSEHQQILLLQSLELLAEGQAKCAMSVTSIAGRVVELKDTIERIEDEFRTQGIIDNPTSTEPQLGDSERANLEKQLHEYERDVMNLEGRIAELRRRLA